MKEYFMFGLKVAVAMLVINQIPFVQDAVQKRYFGGSGQ
jgi:hypothetical protein